MLVYVSHAITGEEVSKELPVTKEEIMRWQSGELIQNVWPDLSSDDREFLMTGMSQEEWDKLAEWKKIGITVKLAEDAEGIIYTVNFRKKALKKDGAKNQPPSVLNAKLVAIDATTVGNGSVANIRLFPYDYTYEGKKGTAFQLQGIQLLRHVVFKPKPFEDFDEAEDTEVVEPEEMSDEPPDDTPEVKW